MNFKESFSSASDVQAQRDLYKGIEFRSKLESKTAQALDNIGIAWVYEPEGYKLSNGMWYRPDFWLPDARQFVECKGVMDAKDSAKIVGLVEDTGRQVLVVSYENAMMVMRFWNDPNGDIMTYTYGDGIALARCERCGKKFFYVGADTFKCPACGAYEGDHHLRWLADIDSGTELFGYGQRVAADKPLYKQIASNFNG